MTGHTLTAPVSILSSWEALRSCSDDDLVAEMRRRRMPALLHSPVLCACDGDHRLYLHTQECLALWDGTLFAFSSQQTYILGWLMHTYPHPATIRALVNFCRPTDNDNHARESINKSRQYLNRLMPEIITITGCKADPRWHLNLRPLDCTYEPMPGRERAERDTTLGIAQYLRKVSR